MLLRYIENYDHWVAFTLLAVVGVRMICSGFDGKDESTTADSLKTKTIHFAKNDGIEMVFCGK